MRIMKSWRHMIAACFCYDDRYWQSPENNNDSKHVYKSSLSGISGCSILLLLLLITLIKFPYWIMRKSPFFYWVIICNYNPRKNHQPGFWRLLSILVGGLEHFLFSHILGIIIPIEFHIFQRGGPTTNQQWSIDCSGCSLFVSKNHRPWKEWDSGGYSRHFFASFCQVWEIRACSKLEKEPSTLKDYNEDIMGTYRLISKKWTDLHEYRDFMRFHWKIISTVDRTGYKPTIFFGLVCKSGYSIARSIPHCFPRWVYGRLFSIDISGWYSIITTILV